MNTHQENNKEDEQVALRENNLHAKSIAGLAVVLLVATGIWYVQIGSPGGMFMYSVLCATLLISIFALVYSRWLIKQAELHEFNYRQLFIIGAITAVLGLRLDILPSLLVGASLMIFGFHNRYRWKKKDLDKQEKLKKAKSLMAIGALVGLGALLLLLLAK